MMNQTTIVQHDTRNQLNIHPAKRFDIFQHAAIKDALASNNESASALSITFDLSGVDFIDLPTANLLHDLAVAAKHKENTVNLVNTADSVRIIFEMLNLNDIL